MNIHGCGWHWHGVVWNKLLPQRSCVIEVLYYAQAQRNNVLHSTAVVFFRQHFVVRIYSLRPTIWIASEAQSVCNMIYLASSQKASDPNCRYLSFIKWKSLNRWSFILLKGSCSARYAHCGDLIHANGCSDHSKAGKAILMQTSGERMSS